MRRLLFQLLASTVLVAVSAVGDGLPVARIAVFANGTIELNGQRIAVAALDQEIKGLAAQSGVVWYYREHALGDPHPNATTVIQTIIRHRLPISMSTKPDFSDYVDQDGTSRPRP